MDKYFYKSDFTYTEHRSDEDYTKEFRFRYYVLGGVHMYEVSHKGDIYTNCQLNDDGTLTVAFHEHFLGRGLLMCLKTFVKDGMEISSHQVYDVMLVNTEEPAVITEELSKVYYGFAPYDTETEELMKVLTCVTDSKSQESTSLINTTTKTAVFWVLTKRATLPSVNDGFGNLLELVRTETDETRVYASVSDAAPGKGFDNVLFTY